MLDQQTEKKIQKMAKSGELKEKLMKEQRFLEQFKGAVAKEGVGISDAEIEKIVTDMQQYASGKKAIPEEVLESVAGGGYKASDFAGGIVLTGFTAALGTGIGAAIGAAGGSKGAKIGLRIGSLAGTITGIALSVIKAVNSVSYLRQEL